MRWSISRDSAVVCLDRLVGEQSNDDNNYSDDNEIDELSDDIESGLNEAFDRSFDKKGEMSKQFDVANFNKIRVGGAFVVTVKKGETHKVIADGSEDSLDEVEVKVEDGTLRVENRRNIKLTGRQKRIGLTIVVPSVEEIDFSGATLSRIENFNNLSSLKVNIAGASKTLINVDVQRLDLSISGTSKAELRGSAKNLEANLAGTCWLDAEQMNIQTAKVEASGVSKANMGNIPNLTSNANGLSRIRRQGEN